MTFSSLDRPFSSCSRKNTYFSRVIVVPPEIPPNPEPIAEVFRLATNRWTLTLDPFIAGESEQTQPSEFVGGVRTVHEISGTKQSLANQRGGEAIQNVDAPYPRVRPALSALPLRESQLSCLRGGEQLRLLQKCPGHENDLERLEVHFPN